MEKLLWVDLEMTGLDVTKEVIIEVGAVVTDLKFTTLEEYHAVVNQPQPFLDSMDEWNQNQHKQSGLVDLIPNGRAPELVEKDLIDLVKKHFHDKPAILCGNSIGQDRLFINKYWPKLGELLHYRLLDVSSWKIIFQNIYDKRYVKTATDHRAVTDIHESINELKYYLQFVDPSRV